MSPTKQNCTTIGRLASVWFFCLGAAACGGNDYGTPPTPAPPPQIANLAPVPAKTTLKCSKGTLLTYANFGRGFMLNYCASCHTSTLTGTARNGAPDGQDFDTNYEVQVWLAPIIKATLSGAPTMPPGGALTSLDASQAKEWLNCGAPL